MREYGFTLTGVGDAEQLTAKLISSDYFTVLGAKPVLGRSFIPGEDKIGAAPIALISAGLWKRKFSSSPDAIGKALVLDGKSYTIVGVIPEAFDLYRSAHPTDVYVPIGQWNNPLLPNRGAGLGIHGVARLKPGVSIEQARADMERVTANLAATYPDSDKGIGANLTPFKSALLGDVQPILLVLLGAVGFVLLIACFNVASLMLARSTGRTREFAVRAALGAGRGRLIRQLLTESILLALVGGGLGLIVAHWTTRAALKMLPADMPRAAEIHLDSHVFIFTAVISLLAGILFGLAPALRSSDLFLSDTLKESGRGSSGTRHRAQSVFVVLEMAMALVLLIGAGLMGRTLSHLWNIQPGFDPHNVLTFSISLAPTMSDASPAAIRSAFRAVHDKFAAAPGVQAVSASWGAVPLGPDDEQLFWLDNQPKPTSENDMNWAISYVVEPDYLKVMRIPLIRGRFFNAADNEHTPPVAVIDEVFAHKFFGNSDPLGHHMTFQQGEARAEIIGVVAHVKQWGLDSDESQQLRAEVYIPFMQLPDAAMKLAPTGTTIMVRSDGSNAALFDSLRRVNKQMSAEQVIYGAQTMQEIIAESLAARRFSMILLGGVRGHGADSFKHGHLRRDFLPGGPAHARNRRAHCAGRAPPRCSRAHFIAGRQADPSRHCHRRCCFPRAYQADDAHALRRQRLRSAHIYLESQLPWHSLPSGPATFPLAARCASIPLWLCAANDGSRRAGRPNCEITSRRKESWPWRYLRFPE